ncbi:MAG: cyclodeaminase/cyclohydrolase family protein [Pygmaiobacter sp.]
MEQMTQLSCDNFVTALASAAPVPGGGGASALVGAIGIALGGMVGSLTTGKKKYAAVEEDIQCLMQRAEDLRLDFMHLVERDAEVFEPLAKAYGLPKDTDEEKAKKQEVLEEVLKQAALVPAEIMDKCLAALDVMNEFADKGSAIAISDAGVGAALCRAALEGASLNVYINTKMMKDRTFAEELNRKTEEKMHSGVPLAQHIFDKVYQRLAVQ